MTIIAVNAPSTGGAANGPPTHVVVSACLGRGVDPAGERYGWTVEKRPSGRCSQGFLALTVVVSVRSGFDQAL